MTSDIIYGDLEGITVANPMYRKVVRTTETLQLVLMSLLPNEIIDMEQHAAEQFIKVEKGNITIIEPDILKPIVVKQGSFAIIPKNVYHEVVAGDNGAKLYIIYSPPQHQDKTADYAKPPSE